MERTKYIEKIKNFENKLKLKNIKNHLKEYTINVDVNDINDFYNSFDKDNFETKDLNQNLEDYLFNKVEKIELLPNLKVNIHCPKDFCVDDETLKTACKNHFEEKSIMQFEKNRKLMNKWIISMICGIFFLGVCLFVSNILRGPVFAEKSFCSVLSEGFGIIGWVAIWEPACYLLYYRKDDKRTLRNYLILSTAEYNIIH